MSALEQAHDQLICERATKLGWTLDTKQSPGMWLADEVERLLLQRDDLAECIDGLGWVTWQTSERDGATWRGRKSEDWQHAKQLVEAVEAEWQLIVDRRSNVSGKDAYGL